MKYVILRTGGKQYRVLEGQILGIEKIEKKPQEKVEFDQILLWVDETERKIGQPLVEGAKVEAEVLEQFKGVKVQVAKFKAKARYRKRKGHRQKLTKVKITKISQGSGKTKEEPTEKPKRAQANPKAEEGLISPQPVKV